MILRNKKTGKIITSKELLTDEFIIDLFSKDFDYFKSKLAELQENWEEYKDELYYIISAEHKGGYICVLKEEYKEICEIAKELGICFEIEKEAQKAAEKFKAWKRLKDKGFRLCGHDDRDRGQLGDIVIYAEMPTFEYDDDSTRNDLDLLFGGEE